MRRNFPVLVMLAAAFLLTSSGFGQQSLGSIARQLRMQKPAPATSQKVFTNDNLPTSGGLGVVSVSSPSQSAAAPEDKANGKAGKASDPAAQQKAIDDDWKQKIEDQKNQIDLIQRELGVLQREAQIRSTVYYADVGTQLRDPQLYHEQAAKNQEDTQKKQKELDDAKQKLADLQDQARKAGASPSAYE
jgi:hypothetical protein